VNVDAHRFFDAIARRYDRVYALTGTASRERLESAIARLPPRAHILDLGVGTGRALSALLDAGHAPTGFDISEEMLALCAKRGRPVPLVRGDFWGRLPFEDASFEGALALHGTLAHPPDLGALSNFAHELGRVLHPGAVLVAEVPAPAWLDAIDASVPSDPRAPIHVRRITNERCVHEDRTAGVAIEAVALPAERWREVFRPAFAAEVESLGAHEWRIVARRV
jgi:SAM-dependent methyltransferase